MTNDDYRREARAISYRLKFAVFFKEGIKNHKPHFEVYRRTFRGVTQIHTTGSPRALALFMRRQEKPLAKRSTGKPFKRAPRDNPARRFRDEADAAHLAQQFHGRAPEDDEREIVDMPNLPDSMANIGRIFAIEYVAERDGKEYVFRHVFKKSSRPHLAVAPDGRLATMLGGAWLFTEDGFVDF